MDWNKAYDCQGNFRDSLGYILNSNLPPDPIVAKSTSIMPPIDDIVKPISGLDRPRSF